MYISNLENVAQTPWAHRRHHKISWIDGKMDRWMGGQTHVFLSVTWRITGLLIRSSTVYSMNQHVYWQRWEEKQVRKGEASCFAAVACTPCHIACQHETQLTLCCVEERVENVYWCIPYIVRGLRGNLSTNRGVSRNDRCTTRLGT